jgi:XTP/dITP diphosphohydrolase
MTKGQRLLDAVALMDRMWGYGGWEAEQTHLSLRKYLIDECYELLDALVAGDDDEIVSELGDLMLQVLFHARIAQAQGRFDIDDIASALADKLTERSPHLTNGHTGPLDPHVQDAAWEARKRAALAAGSCLDGIPHHAPSLLLADKILARVRKFAFPDELVPDDLRTVTLGSGTAEVDLRRSALAFADRVRCTELRHGATPASAREWQAQWTATEQTE